MITSSVIALGVVIVVVARRVPGLRGVSKAVVKGGRAVVDRSREVFSSTGENWADLVAEARQEMGAAGRKSP